MAIMFMSVSDERFINKSDESKIEGAGQENLAKDNQMQTCTREDMIKFLNRLLDRNKPLFLFNSKATVKDTIGDSGTPSFSMVALIDKN
jgi:hypothetical protein